MDWPRRGALLAAGMALVFAVGAVATLGPPSGFVDDRPKCAGLIKGLDCFGGPVPDAWDQLPTIWFVVACMVTLVIAIGLRLAPSRREPT